ncbi:hypothetical protein FF011L_08570 [Roseimaritima multifibrata]|uniref:Uncharacterized protein n=1 Tax=Roseimaritima multifibrata TaxID=1930274 RepID=A0A517MB98_9BACT|nr:hypothetical protein FF011L_08570 [Roseimaritima multifibrata]
MISDGCENVIAIRAVAKQGLLKGLLVAAPLYNVLPTESETGSQKKASLAAIANIVADPYQCSKQAKTRNRVNQNSASTRTRTRTRTPSLLHSFTPSLLHSFTPSLLHSVSPQKNPAWKKPDGISYIEFKRFA